MNKRLSALFPLTAVAAAVSLAMIGCGGGSSTSATDEASTLPNENIAQPEDPNTAPAVALSGSFVEPFGFTNPYSHIPAQCHIETSRGTQNACQFCHTNGPYNIRLGNSFPQAGLDEWVGNLQLEYSFAPHNAFEPPATINFWENTLTPEKLKAAVAALGIDPALWDMESYIRTDNWSEAFAKRPGDLKSWDGAQDTAFRLFPALDPADLPADKDGFVRSTQEKNGFFNDGQGWISGWRAVNFMPYGIFTPMTGSVSGIYIRLPAMFMQDDSGAFSLEIYKRNLDLVERAIQDRLRTEDGTHFVGKASAVAINRGHYPVGTEFAHPLHYVDVSADGSDPEVSPFPGTRSKRVKEVRYMYKWKEYIHEEYIPARKVEGLPIYGNESQGWVDNGVGWYLAAFIEDKEGALRPQNFEELMQCVGCHSGINRVDGNQTFYSGTGNTIDSTWAMPRKFAGDAGWGEMNYLGYVANQSAGTSVTPGKASMGDPLNRTLGKGELRYFIEAVVGASLYGDMPASIDSFLSEEIRAANEYSADWPKLDTSSAENFNASQALRQQLLREFTARGGHLADDGTVQPALLYPPKEQALAGAARYRQVVATQRYNLGKDVFPETPVTFKYFRQEGEHFTRIDGTAYQTGDIVTERTFNTDYVDPDLYLVGNVTTLVDENRPYAEGGNYNPDYLPLLSEPLMFEARPAPEPR